MEGFFTREEALHWGGIDARTLKKKEEDVRNGRLPKKHIHGSS